MVAQNNTNLSWGFESKSNTAVMTEGLLLLGFFAVQEDSWLLLKSFFSLLTQNQYVIIQISAQPCSKFKISVLTLTHSMWSASASTNYSH